jgi:hypothetical protein
LITSLINSRLCRSRGLGTLKDSNNKSKKYNIVNEEDLKIEPELEKVEEQVTVSAK